MNQVVVNLASIRKVEAEYLQEIAEIDKELAATPLGQRLARCKELLGVARLDKADAEDVVRNAALQVYEATGDKQPHPAVKVVMSTVLYYDQGAALDYCRQHLSKALKLDRGEFEKAAKVIEPEFVIISQMPTTRIASDLTAYLDQSLNEEEG
ncbi:MAG: hypothetical protein FJ008_09770 [Chloroflexi bacterium]|nr:hypothetical protein [Chloroflexota bacterium]